MSKTSMATFNVDRPLEPSSIGDLTRLEAAGFLGMLQQTAEQMRDGTFFHGQDGRPSSQQADQWTEIYDDALRHITCETGIPLTDDDQYANFVRLAAARWASHEVPGVPQGCRVRACVAASLPLPDGRRPTRDEDEAAWALLPKEMRPQWMQDERMSFVDLYRALLSDVEQMEDLEKYLPEYLLEHATAVLAFRWTHGVAIAEGQHLSIKDALKEIYAAHMADPSLPVPPRGVRWSDVMPAPISLTHRYGHASTATQVNQAREEFLDDLSDNEREQVEIPQVHRPAPKRGTPTDRQALREIQKNLGADGKMPSHEEVRREIRRYVAEHRVADPTAAGVGTDGTYARGYGGSRRDLSGTKAAAFADLARTAD